jgi:hypothetical protein
MTAGRTEQTMDQLRLDLNIASEWERIDAVREAVARCVSAVFGDVELKQQLGMVSAELLENAVKYGRGGKGVSLSIRGDTQELVVMVANAVDKGSHHAQLLQRRLRWLRAFKDPFEAYTAALQQVYDRSTPDAEDNGLGLARIYYEGRCQIDCDVSQPELVSVSARFRGQTAPAGGSQPSRSA